MKLGKIIVTTACSLLMSGAAFAEIAPAPVDNSVLELSVVSERISTADNDYGKASAILDSFYDNSTGNAVMSEQTPVYVEWNFREDKKSLALTQEKSNIITKTRNSIVPLLNTNTASTKNLFEESLHGLVNNKDIQYDFDHVSKVGGCHRKCVASHTEKQCINRRVCHNVCHAGTVVCYVGSGGNSICGPGVAICHLVCEVIPECSTVTICDEWTQYCW